MYKLKSRAANIRTSLYTDDATIFVVPIKEDFHTLAMILHNFGLVTDLNTNLHKSSVVAIRCDMLDLHGISQNFPTIQTGFPMKYLELPLAINKLRQIDIQPLEDKAATKLAA